MSRHVVLTDQARQKIRDLYAQYGLTHKQLARRFECSEDAIQRAVSGIVPERIVYTPKADKGIGTNRDEASSRIRSAMSEQARSEDEIREHGWPCCCVKRDRKSRMTHLKLNHPSVERCGRCKATRAESEKIAAKMRKDP